MAQAQLIDQSLLRQTMVEIANLPDDDLAVLLGVVEFLKQQRTKATVRDIRQAARQRAAELQGLPREELTGRFLAVGERIRSQAVAQGTAIEGDWESD